MRFLQQARADTQRLSRTVCRRLFACRHPPRIPHARHAASQRSLGHRTGRGFRAPRTGQEAGTEIIMHDRDTKFTASFDAVLKKAGPRRPPIGLSGTQHGGLCRAVRAEHQAGMPRLLRGVRRAHMDHLCREFIEHYHAERPHQGLDNELLKPRRGRTKAPARLDSSGRHRLPHPPGRPAQALPPQSGVAKVRLTAPIVIRSGRRSGSLPRLRNRTLESTGLLH